jgi:hypothetical protein
MMNPARKASLIAVASCAAALAATAAVRAQPRGESAAGLVACAGVESAIARLDCYDNLARRAAAEDARAETQRAGSEPVNAESPRDEPTPAAGRPVEVPAANSPRPSRREARAADRAALEFWDRVAELREIQPGRLEVTLANGQVWRQTNSDRYELQPGHDVHLYPSGFGQYYRLSALELRGFIQVERVR